METANKLHTVVELFSGPGGLSLGFHLAGFQTIVAYEFEDDCINTYEANFKNTEVIKKDLSKFNDEDIDNLKKVIYKKTGYYTVDIVMGGPPCRSFSTSNPRKKYEDYKDYLYKSLIIVANELNAKYFIMENVGDIFSKSVKKGSNKKVFHRLLEDLQENGFHYINFKLLNSADFGVPQKRERVFIIATKDPCLPLTFPGPTHSEEGGKLPKWVTVEEAFEDLPEVVAPRDPEFHKYKHPVLKNKNKQYYCNEYSSKPRNDFARYCRGIPSKTYPYKPFPWINYDPNKLDLFIIPNHTERIIKRYSLLQQGENQGQLVERYKESYPEKYAELLENRILPKGVFRQKNRKLFLDQPARTVTSHSREELVHPCFNRNLTAREVTRLQGFPDWFIFKGVNQLPFKPDSNKDVGTGRDYYQQAGDAVPPLLAAAIAKEVKYNLTTSKKAAYPLVRKILIEYLYTNNLSITELKKSELEISKYELSDILTGTLIHPPKHLLERIIITVKNTTNTSQTINIKEINKLENLASIV